MNTVFLADAIRGSSRKALFTVSWVFIAWSWALQVQSFLGKRRCGLAKEIGWLCPPYVEETTLCQSRCWPGRAGDQRVDEPRRVSYLFPG